LTGQQIQARIASLHSKNSEEFKVGDTRKLYMVLSPHSLPYAKLALRSLFDNCVEDFHLSLITDSRDDAILLSNELAELQTDERTANRSTGVYAAEDLLDAELDRLEKHHHIRNFRLGHPCWRKITDPLLLSADKEEMIVLDPDLYFPNRFSFEPTPNKGVFLMWQRPSCLLPDEVVRRAIDAKISLAHHTDIGVAQWRMPVDLEWLDWLIGKIGSSQLPRSMHVESIVWAALAMHLGGGHLDPEKWVCWHRTQYKRVLVKLGVQGASILKLEPFSDMKCFHAGGEAKWWLPGAKDSGILNRRGDVTAPSEFRPYQELMPREYDALQRRRHMLRKLGYYSLFGG
jgi:hypothetical protein